MNSASSAKTKQSPQIWAVGGGKGGVGKSVVSILLALSLARQNRRIVLIDADLAGANLHTMMGIKTPVRTLNDFVTGKYKTLQEICIPASQQGMQLICGASEIFSLANLPYAQKNKILQSVTQLACDYVILDLGAGNSYNVLDFFLVADHPIVVMTPQPTSVQNAYGFIRNTIYRKLSRLASRKPRLQELIKNAMEPNNDSQMNTIHDLLNAVSDCSDSGQVSNFQEAVSEFRPWLITNMTRNGQGNSVASIVQNVTGKYLTIRAEELGAIGYDSMIENRICQMQPVSGLPADSEALVNATAIVQRLLERGDRDSSQ